MSNYDFAIRNWFLSNFTPLKDERIREFDADGALSASGVRWVQFSSGWLLVVILLVIAGIAVAIPTLFNLPVWERVLIAAGLVTGGYALSGRIYVKHEIRFLRDGTIATPYGFSGWPRRRTIDGNHANIRTIELGRPASKDDESKFHVAIFGEGGEHLWLTHKLNEGDALKITVQTIQALNEIREGLRQEDLNAARRPQAVRQWSDSDTPSIGG